MKWGLSVDDKQWQLETAEKLGKILANVEGLPELKESVQKHLNDPFAHIRSLVPLVALLISLGSFVAANTSCNGKLAPPPKSR
jgi:hypothetical protein